MKMNLEKMILKVSVLFSLLLLVSCGRTNEKFYVKHVEFSTDATLEEKIEKAAHLVPTEQQLAWQKMELTAFLHFGMNTFTGREWGDGQENPKIFNPTELDAEQWVRCLKENGFNLVILTAKHHDGFCLWPTQTTKHSVKFSPWKDGKGDVVKELRAACYKYDMKFGVYLSPWDRNADCYGDSPKYNQFFIEQLTELLTNYGEVHEVWFDGACAEGPNGRKQVYDWDAIYKTIRQLQPKAVTAIMGDDVRWVGNERGLGRETEWSATVLCPGGYSRALELNSALGVKETAQDLGSREKIASAKELFWFPSEVDVSIRPGWFYHETEDSQVKSLEHLMDIYFRSVGYNSVLLLNIPPDTRGLISEADVSRLKEFAEYRDRIFSKNLLKKESVDWNAQPGDQHIFELINESEVNVVMLQEDITKGQRVESFTVEARTAEGWQIIGKGTTIGYKRLLRLPSQQMSAIRLTINSSRLDAHICGVGAYYAEPLSSTKVQGNCNDVDRKFWNVMSETPLTIDLGSNVAIKSFVYAPENAQAKPDMAFRFVFSTSEDGRNWVKHRLSNEFSNIMHNPVPQTIGLAKVTQARYVRLDATTVADTPAKVLATEFGILVDK